MQKTTLQVQDPKTFGLPNKEKVANVIKLFFSEDKEQFLNAYYSLNNTDKFYAISVCVCDYTDVKMATKMFLEELREDLTILKILNKPSTGTKLDTSITSDHLIVQESLRIKKDALEKIKGFGYEYTGYQSADPSIWDRICQQYYVQ